MSCSSSGTYEPLPHRRGWNQKDGDDGFGGKAEDRLQYQRGADGRLDFGMGAGEHKGDTPVGYFTRCLTFGVKLIRNKLEMFLEAFIRSPALRVDQPPAGDCKRPPLRIARDTLRRPSSKRGREGLRQRILRAPSVLVRRPCSP